jgi:hypothetical protein
MSKFSSFDASSKELSEEAGGAGSGGAEVAAEGVTRAVPPSWAAGEVGTDIDPVSDLAISTSECTVRSSFGSEGMGSGEGSGKPENKPSLMIPSLLDAALDADDTSAEPSTRLVLSALEIADSCSTEEFSESNL